MKKVFLATLLVVSAANAHNGHGHHQHSSDDSERMSIIWNFGTAAALAAGLNKLSTTMRLSTAMHGVLQTANGLWALGAIASNPVFNDLAVRSLLAAGAMAVANHPKAEQLAASTPFIGQGLSTSGKYLTGMLVVSTYKTLEIGLKKFCDMSNARDVNWSFCQE